MSDSSEAKPPALKRHVGFTLDGEIVDMLQEASTRQAKLRHQSPKVSPYLNEILHRYLPGELDRLRKETN